MAPSQRTRLALFKKKETTRNKEIIDISDDEDNAPSGWNISNPYLSKTYCDTCGKEIAKEEETCDMCFVMNSYARDCEFFGYNLNAPTSLTEDEIQDTQTSSEPERKFCAFCGWEMPIEESENCEECTLQVA